MGKITLTNIAEELAHKSGLSKDAADNFMRAIVDTIEKGLREDNIVKIKGLGTFKLMEVSDRGSIDVNTGERITIKGYTKVTFTPDSAMKEFINRPFAHFEPTELNEGFQDEELVVDEEQAITSTENSEEEINTSLSIEAISEDEMDNVQDADLQSEDDVAITATEIEILSDEPNIEDAPVVTDEETLAEQEIVQIESVTGPQSDIVSIEEDVVSEDSNICNENQIAPTLDSRAIEENIVLSAQAVVQSEEDMAVDAPVQDSQVEANDIHSTPEPAQPKVHSRRGVWLFIIVLLLIIAGGLYFYLSSNENMADSNNFAVVDEKGTIIVNPNLEEELDSKYSENSVNETIQTSPISDSLQEGLVTTYEPSTKDVGSSISETEQNQVAGESKVITMDSQYINTLMGTLVITESLANKSIKDITPADTLDFVIDGTHTIHTLQSGETIIQLSRKYYGDKRLWPYIVKYNNIIDFNKVAVGTVLHIPILKDKSEE